jgi:hypothetical protein
MSSTARGFAVRDVVQHGRNGFGQVNVNFGKVLPASTTGNLFVIVGSIQASLVGVVSTVGSATGVSPTVGYTGKAAALSAAPAAPLTTQAVGSVFKLPEPIGGALPVPLVANSATGGLACFTISNTTITITTAATNTMAITWILCWMPIFFNAKSGATPSVTNS